MASAEELSDKGMDLFAEGKYGEAVRAYEEAIAADPTFIDAHHGLAMALAESGDLERAIAAAKRLTEVAPDDALGFTCLSIFYQRSGKIAEAESAASQARIREWKDELKGDD